LLWVQTLLWRKNRQSAVHAKKSNGFKEAGNKVQDKLELDKFGTQWGSLNGRQWYDWPVPPLSPASSHRPPRRPLPARTLHALCRRLLQRRG